MRKIIKSFLVIILFMMAALSAEAIVGKWKGDLNVQGVSLPLVLNMNNSGDSISSTMDSPLQNVYGLPVKIDYMDSDSLAWSCDRIGASFHGQISGQKISGTFQQRGFKFPLTLTPEESLSVRRPQTPQPPFPYQAIDTTFMSEDGILLAGTLTLPDDVNGKKFPIVVMVTGSGPQNRDEKMFDHKPFAVIADYMARHGIASFRYDDRGTAESRGSFREADTDVFCNDAKAALNFARNIKGVDRAGILGHSEGGTIAFMLAAEGEPDFIISLAGMAISGKETILDQNSRALHKSGFTPQQIQQSLKLISDVFDEIIVQTVENRISPINVDSIARAVGFDIPPMVVQSVKSNIANRSPYFGKMIQLDARKSMGNIKCPVLAINGNLDSQVDASKNLSAIRSGVPHAHTYELQGLNHLMQHATTGDITEYVSIRETISPDVLKLIVDFVRNH